MIQLLLEIRNIKIGAMCEQACAHVPSKSRNVLEFRRDVPNGCTHVSAVDTVPQKRWSVSPSCALRIPIRQRSRLEVNQSARGA